MSTVLKYAQAISEQVKQQRALGLHTYENAINEANEHWSFDPDKDKVKKHPSLEAAKEHVEKLNNNEDREQSAAVHEVKPSADGKRGTIVKTHDHVDEGEWHTHTADKGDELIH